MIFSRCAGSFVSKGQPPESGIRAVGLHDAASSRQISTPWNTSPVPPVLRLKRDKIRLIRRKRLVVASRYCFGKSGRRNTFRSPFHATIGRISPNHLQSILGSYRDGNAVSSGSTVIQRGAYRMPEPNGLLKGPDPGRLEILLSLLGASWQPLHDLRPFQLVQFHSRLHGCAAPTSHWSLSQSRVSPSPSLIGRAEEYR